MVIVISPTIQEFQGERFYLCGLYFQKRGRRLHREVWKAINGLIPKGWHVHHKDHNRSNNQPDNLELLQSSKHATRHLNQRTEQSRLIVDAIRPKAAEWHGSEAGVDWHKGQYEKHCRAAFSKLSPKECLNCNQIFQGICRAKYCSNGCKSSYRLKTKADYITKTCPVCKKEFQSNKYWNTYTCSSSCGGKVKKTSNTIPLP